MDGRFIPSREVREEINIPMVKSISSLAPNLPHLPMRSAWSDLLVTVIKQKTSSFSFLSYSFPFSKPIFQTLTFQALIEQLLL